MKAPGPVSPMTTPEPTNRPAPITPPIAIIVSCRWLSAFFKVGVALIASLRYSTYRLLALWARPAVGFRGMYSAGHAIRGNEPQGLNLNRKPQRPSGERDRTGGSFSQSDPGE